MDVYAAIEARRTIRDFQAKKIPQDIVRKIIAAGFKAPTNDHLKRWEFVLVNDKAAREKVLRIESYGNTNDINKRLDNWGLSDEMQRDMYLDALPKQFAMLFNAGCLILPFFRNKKPLLQPATLSELNEFASIWCCIENMLIAAASEGIFGVTRIPMTEESEHIKKVIGHPDDYVMPCYIALGYPTDDAVRTRQKQISVEERIHINTW